MLPDKAQGAYSVQLAWAAPHGDLWVDICENAAFAPGTFANKHAGAVSFTDAPNGFSNGLTLQPGKTYFWRRMGRRSALLRPRVESSRCGATLACNCPKQLGVLWQ